MHMHSPGGNKSDIFVNKSIHWSKSGALEPPKAAKEHETYASCQVPSQSKFIGHYNQIVSI